MARDEFAPAFMPVLVEASACIHRPWKCCWPLLTRCFSHAPSLVSPPLQPFLAPSSPLCAQNPHVPHKTLECLRDLQRLYDAATVDDIKYVYEQFQFDDDNLYTCVGTSGERQAYCMRGLHD